VRRTQGLPTAIETVWPQAITQTCVVHLLRNSFRYASKKHWAALAKDLKPIYTAPSESAALDSFVAVTEAWGDRYPAIIKLWEYPSLSRSCSSTPTFAPSSARQMPLNPSTRGSAERSTPAATFPPRPPR
jgi:hypothetical protein